MHKSLNNFGLASAALALAITPTMAGAQQPPARDTAADAPEAAATAPEAAPLPAPTTEQLAQVDSWPQDKQAKYKAWPPATQAYYWSLNAERQAMFWALSDNDKVAISQMGEPQRESTWAQIESQMKPPRA